MTGAIWVLLMTGGVAALLAAVSRRRLGEWAAPAVFLLTGVIYAFALAGAPALGCRAAQALGLASLAAAAVLAARRREARHRILTGRGGIGTDRAGGLVGAPGTALHASG